ncbi:MAG: HIT family protein [Planctomycetota bacterium]
MSEFNRNLWAPWRMEYIHSLVEHEGKNDCFLCEYAGQPDKDGAHHVVWRGAKCFTVFNRFPYSSGHLLISPLEHLADMDNLDDGSLVELISQVRDSMSLLRKTVWPHGFNVGMNFGRCAGAGLPDHLHVHVVPRWDGDTNFMPVFGDVKVIPLGIEELYETMRGAVGELGLPPVRG